MTSDNITNPPEPKGRLNTKTQKAIKREIDLHQELTNSLYSIERLILQETQTEFSDDALQGLTRVIQWNYDKIQKLSDLL